MALQSVGSHRHVVVSDPDYPREDTDMEFRLAYKGELKSNGSPKHKHEIRRVLHAQLKQLWSSQPYLKGALWAHPQHGYHVPNKLLRDRLAEQWARLGYNFVPLVTVDLSLACGLDILFLRPSMPGELMKSGDIDGRMKTLFDALRMPDTLSELGGYTAPQSDEKPFYCLLQDDKLITHLSITTDALLDPAAGTNDAHLIISVNLKPVNQGWHNINFGGA